MRPRGNFLIAFHIRIFNDSRNFQVTYKQNDRCAQFPDGLVIVEFDAGLKENVQQVSFNSDTKICHDPVVA
jgi:hypothetical protein